MTRWRTEPAGEDAAFNGNLLSVTRNTAGDHEEIDGPVNIASPNPPPNAEFMRILREAWGAKVGLPATRWMLEIGAVFLRTETELVLKSRRVVPGRLLANGFEFEYPDWDNAATELVTRWRTP